MAMEQEPRRSWRAWIRVNAKGNQPASQPTNERLWAINEINVQQCTLHNECVFQSNEWGSITAMKYRESSIRFLSLFNWNRVSLERSLPSRPNSPHFFLSTNLQTNRVNNLLPCEWKEAYRCWWFLFYNCVTWFRSICTGKYNSISFLSCHTLNLLML